MSASLAPSAAPPNALKVWCDSTRIYAELPSSGPTCVMAFPRTGLGLSKVLNLVYGSGEWAGSIAAPSRKLVGTPMQHDIAQSILRKQGIIR